MKPSKAQASKPSKTLTAVNLKDALWSTLQNVQAGAVQPAEADAIASQAREILRTVKIQLGVAAQSKRKITGDVLVFAEGE